MNTNPTDYGLFCRSYYNSSSLVLPCAANVSFCFLSLENRILQCKKTVICITISSSPSWATCMHIQWSAWGMRTETQASHLGWLAVNKKNITYMVRKYILENAHNQQFTVFVMGMKCITSFRWTILKADNRFLKKKKKKKSHQITICN